MDRIDRFQCIGSKWRSVLGWDFILNWFSAVFRLGFARDVLVYPVSLFDGSFGLISVDLAVLY